MFSKLNLSYPDEINKILEGLISIYDECCSNIIVYGSTAVSAFTIITTLFTSVISRNFHGIQRFFPQIYKAIIFNIA